MHILILQMFRENCRIDGFGHDCDGYLWVVGNMAKTTLNWLAVRWLENLTKLVLTKMCIVINVLQVWLARLDFNVKSHLT